MSVDIQPVLVVTLDVAVGTQHKQLCLWTYNTCPKDAQMIVIVKNFLQ